MIVDIFLPRLDVTFKPGPLPKKRGVVIPLRKYWSDFCNILRHTHIQNGDKVRILEVPLWQITPSLVQSTSKEADLIYIPHKMKANWFLDNRVRYYMQMVIPSIFSIDKDGWCASASFSPIIKNSQTSTKIFNELKKRIKKNQSKFPQPTIQELDNFPKSYILFPCQIPHDETIRFHSDIGVEQALRVLLGWMVRYPSNYSLIVKGHPVNQDAMKPLKQIYSDFLLNLSDTSQSHRFKWIDQVSIHQLLSSADAVATVNSGVGLEAILHQKKVFTFGNADYSSIATKIMYGGSLDNAIDNLQASMLIESNISKEDYKKDCEAFIDAWYSEYYDVDNISTFSKLLKKNA